MVIIVYLKPEDLEFDKAILRKDFKTMTYWFNQNNLVQNHKKCRYMCIGKNTDQDSLAFENSCLTSNKED